METQNKLSGFLSLGTKDIVRGFTMAALGSILTGAMTIINSGKFPMDFASWKPILIGGIGAGVTYLCHKLFTNSNNEFMKADQTTDQK